jgi:phosphoribosylformimino-5-aminoimidazole carboxamide ribotide isomerase
MLIIPALDLQNGKCVRLLQGRKESATVYGDDPVAVATQFAQAGARLLHVVDLDAAFGERSSANRRVLGRIIETAAVPVQFGGGLRTFDDVKDIIELGVTRAIIGTLAVESPEMLNKLVNSFGSEHVAIGIDAKDGEVMVRGWEAGANMRALDLALVAAEAGIERIIYTDVTRDGMLGGVNLEQALLIARESGVKITASGGVSSLEDIRRIKEQSQFGIDSVIVGKALYEGRFTLEEALKAGAS